MEIEGQRNTKRWLPHMLGHEAVEIIIFIRLVKNLKKEKMVPRPG